MPILWKYLLKSYFQFLFICVSAFVAVLLVIRFQDIAYFASSGAGILYIALFSLYQIPYILPLAIPISCLIASMVLFQRMSSSLELTALRASGIALAPIAYPFILSALVLCLLNFTIISEIAPVTRIKAKNLIYEIAQENPLIVLQKDSMLDIKTVAFDLKSLQLGKKAKEVLCVIRQSSSERIGLFTVQELFVDKNFIYGKSVSILSSVDSGMPEGYDHLVIENQKTMQSDKSMVFTQLFQADWFNKDDLLSFKNLLEKCKTSAYRLTSSPVIELIRRSCLGFCPLTFTLLGIGFGTTIGRHKKKGAILTAFVLASLIMVCFVASKTIQKSVAISLLLYLIPQPIAILLSIRNLRLSSKGIE